MIRPVFGVIALVPLIVVMGRATSAAMADAPPALPQAGRDRQGRLGGSRGVLVGFSADGGRILTAGGGEARVWDGRTYRSLSAPLRHDGKDIAVVAAAISPDGTRVATAGGSEAAVWDAGTGRRLLALRHPGPVADVAF